MTTEIMKIKVLYPSENHYLYNAEAKTTTDKVFLGKDANKSDWQEITLDKKKDWKKNGEKKQRR